MGLTRLLTDIFGKTINQNAIDKLNNSSQNEIKYRDGKLIKGAKIGLTGGAVIFESSFGLQKIYNSKGSDVFQTYTNKT
jgi:hypothetical protein